MNLIVETRWKSILDGTLYGGSTNQVLDNQLKASQKLSDAVAMAKRMADEGSQVAFVRDFKHKATRE